MSNDKQLTSDFEVEPSAKMTPFENWWELVGSKMKNEPGENIHDTYLPFRIAKRAWEAAQTKDIIKTEDDFEHEPDRARICADEKWRLCS